MIKIYDTNHNFLSLLDSCKDVYTTETLKTGLKTLNFKVSVNDKHLDIIQEEYYVETADASYVIKEVINEDNTFIQVFCGANV